MVLPKTASENDNNEAAAVKVNSNQEVNNETAKAKTANQKQEDTDKVETSSTNENVAESTSNSKTVVSDSDVNSNNLNTNTFSVKKLSRNTNEDSLLESKVASDEITSMTPQEFASKINEHAMSFHKTKQVVRTLILNKPQGTQSIQINPPVQPTDLDQFGENIERRLQVRILAGIYNNEKRTSLANINHYNIDYIYNSSNVTGFVSTDAQNAYNEFMALNTTDPSLKVNLPAFDSNDINVDGYTAVINKQKSNSQNIGAESFQPYTDTPQTVVIDYTRDVEGNINKKVTEIINKSINNQVMPEPARTVILKKTTTGADKDETIVQEADIRGFTRTTNRKVSGTTEKTIEVAIAPYVEPNKPSSQYYKKYTITFNPDTGQIISGQDDYDQLMALKRSDFKVDLPAIDTTQFDIPGYTWKITSATPAGADLGAEAYTFGNPQTIIIDYTKEQKHSVTYKFIDKENNNTPVGSDVVVSGDQDTTQETNLTVPDNYELAQGSTLPTSVKIGDTDSTVNINLVHKKNVTTSTEIVTRNITITEPGKTPNTQTQSANFTKTTTTDLVTNKSTDSYDHNTQTLPEVPVPNVPGYTPSQTPVRS